MSSTPFALTHQEGEALWFNHDLLVFRATNAQTDGAFILFEQTSQGGKTTPLHRHAEDETFYVLEGELVVHIDGTDFPGKPGSIIFVPRGTPHAFLVTSDRFRGLILFTPGSEACEQWFRTAGDPAPAYELPQPGAPDVARLQAAAEQYGVEMLGPPPFPTSVASRSVPPAP